MNADLGFTPDEAAQRLGHEVDRAIARVREIGAELLEQLQGVASINAADLVALAQAERAVVQDFEIRHTRASRVGLTFDCGMGTYPVELSTALGEGEYRAVILISRRK